MKDSSFDFQVFSEIAPLKSVLLHRPGRELETLTPRYLDSMLFEDIPFLERMQSEHDQFAALLRKEGSEVLYFDDLLTEVLQDDAVRADVIRRSVGTSEVRDVRIREALISMLSSLEPEALTSYLIGGVQKTDVGETTEAKDLSYYIRDEYPYYISPLPNLYFTRDPGTTVGRRFSVNTMNTSARRRETLLLSVIMHNQGESLPGRLLEDYTGGASIEGGDILILDEHTLAVGCSARSEAWAIERLADRVLTQEGFSRLLVIQIPFTRAYMHLDTVFTMVDHDKFTIYPGVERRLKVFSLTKDHRGSLGVTQERDLGSALAGALGLPAVDLIATGGGDMITAAREQWNDSTNTLAVAPGKVVTYRRNVVSNETLTTHGIEVLPIDGSELVRGRGGPRCMSMPLYRSRL